MKVYTYFFLTLAVFRLPAAAAPNYVNIAATAGLTARTTFGSPVANNYILETTGTGAAIFDFDGDGDNDIFVVNGTTFELAEKGNSPLSQLYRNDGAGNFEDVASEVGLTAAGWGQGACIGDFDNDDRPDLFVTYFGSNVLYRNLSGNAGARFENVTAAAGLPTDGNRWGAGCAFLDFDGDGFLDVFVSNYVDLDLANTPRPGSSDECKWKGMAVMCGPRGLPRALNVLYRNTGKGKFEDVSEQAGILKPGGRYGLGVVSADFNNDGLSDIYVACDMTPSLLYQNNGDGTFEEIGGAAGVAYSADGQLQAGMGVAVADYDGNGFIDLIKTNFSGDLPSLYNNEDGVFFEDVSAGAGLGANQLLGWGVVFVDADEDSRPDILMAHGHVYPEVNDAAIGETYDQKTIFYRNLGEGRFEDASKTAGPAFEAKRPARGMASGDLDGDGYPEIVIVNVNQPPALLRGDPPAGNAVVLELQGSQSNRSAIGARFSVEFGGRSVARQVIGGGSYFSQSDLSHSVGLGQADVAEEVTVEWPSGKTQRWGSLAANHRYILVEGKSKPLSSALAR